MEQRKRYLFTNQDLMRLIAPLIVEQILAVTVGMADTMMVSSAGEAAGNRSDDRLLYDQK